MTGWTQFPLSAFSLLVLWLLLVGSVAPGQVLFGAVLAASITGLTARFWPRRRRPRRPWLLFCYLLRLGVDIVVANFSVALLVLDPSRRVRPGFVEYPLTIADPFAIYLLMSAISLTPGTVSADLRRTSEQDHLVLLIHVMDVGDSAEQAQALCRDVKHRYEDPLLEIFR
jgi:multicomponent K+:H+ antiporter subunit E